MSTYETHTQEGTDEIIEADDEGEVLEDVVNWSGPFDEFNQYGNPTGATYVRCSDCGIEVLTDSKNHASHRPACRHSQE